MSILLPWLLWKIELGDIITHKDSHKILQCVYIERPGFKCLHRSMGLCLHCSLVRLNIAIILFFWPTVLSFFIFLLARCLSKWLLCSAVAVGEAALMMMTGSLKQAKQNALPRGLIFCTNLPLISLCLCIFFCLSALFFLFLMIWGSLGPFLVLDEIFCLFLLALHGHLTGLSEPQAPSPDCLSPWEMDSPFSLLSFSAAYMNTHTLTYITSHIVAWIWPVDYFLYLTLFWWVLLPQDQRGSDLLCVFQHAYMRIVVLGHFYTAELHIPWALLSEYISGEVNVGVSQPLIGQLSPCISVTRQHALPLLFVRLGTAQ